MKARARFEIVVVFDDGAYLKITSRKDRRWTASEIVAQLRHNADLIERGLDAPARPVAPEVK